MVIRTLFIVISLLFVSPVLAQFGQQSNRLTDAASRLSRDAEDFANAAYNNYTNSMRSNNRTDTEALVIAQQFAGASRIFYRMAVDRRRNQELRDVYDMLQNLARSLERYNPQRNTWDNVTRSLADVGREIGGANDGPFPPDTGGSRTGRINWRGRVDDDVRITFRGGSAEVETLGGTEYSDSQPNFSNSLPFRRVTVRLEKRRGRGEVYIEEQPTRQNNFAVVVRIKDSRGGASDYEFDLVW